MILDGVSQTPLPENREGVFVCTRKTLLAVALLFCSLAVTAMDTLSLRIRDQTLELEVARTEAERERGLMGRCTLRENTGMAFFFNPPESVGFWMKNTLINLDIAFVDTTGVVFHTDTMRANSLTLHHSYGFATASHRTGDVLSGIRYNENYLRKRFKP